MIFIGYNNIMTQSLLFLVVDVISYIIHLKHSSVYLQRFTQAAVQWFYQFCSCVEDLNKFDYSNKKIR